MKEVWFYLKQNSNEQISSSIYYDTFEQAMLAKHEDKYAVLDMPIMKGYIVG